MIWTRRRMRTDASAALAATDNGISVAAANCHSCACMRCPYAEGHIQFVSIANRLPRTHLYKYLRLAQIAWRVFYIWIALSFNMISISLTLDTQQHEHEHKKNNHLTRVYMQMPERAIPRKRNRKTPDTGAFNQNRTNVRCDRPIVRRSTM